MPLPPEDLSKDRLLSSLPRNPEGHPVLGGIPLLRRIGKGGMGAVYYGLHPRLDIEVAVKILPHHLVEEDAGLVQRFFGEARMAAKLESEHIVRMLDVNEEGDTKYIVMQYVRGESAGGLLKRLKEEGKAGLDERAALDLVLAATRGLAAAHRSRIVHRDIKPDNILVPDGDLRRAKLADLGLAKPEGGAQTFGTLSYVAMGTPGYMAPEQAENARAAGPPADVFSMGATLYALLNGDGPFRGTSLATILRDTAQKEPDPLPDRVSEETRALVRRCLDKDPAKRFPGGESLLAALERLNPGDRPSTLFAIEESRPPAAVAIPTPQLPAHPPRRRTARKAAAPAPKQNRAASFLLTALGIAAAAGLAAWLGLRDRKGPEPPPAKEAREVPVPEKSPADLSAFEREGQRKCEEGLQAIRDGEAMTDPARRRSELTRGVELVMGGLQLFDDSSGKYIEALKAARARLAAPDPTPGPSFALLREKAEKAFKRAPEENNSVPAWDAALAEAKAAQAAARTPSEKEEATRLTARAARRRDHAAAAAAEKDGRIEDALKLAESAVAADPGAPESETADFQTYVARLRAMIAPATPKGSGPEPAGTGSGGGFGSRLGGKRNLVARGGGSTATEDAVLAALQWLARHQAADGSWRTQGYRGECRKMVRYASGSVCSPNPGDEDLDAGNTGLALLAFLGAGYTPRSKDVHDGIFFSDVVRKGLQWLLDHQDPEGCIGSRNSQKYMYNHLVGTMALTEAFGLTGSDLYKGPAQKAVDFTVAAQNPGKGWRYSARCGDNDSSVTGWAVMALKSAELAGLTFPRKGLDGARAWFDETTEGEYFRVGYTQKGTGKVFVPGMNENFDHHEALTAIGVLARIFIDKSKSDPRLSAGCDLLLRDKPKWDANAIDFYYWHYAGLALFQFDGPAGPKWKAWNEDLKNALVKNQNAASSGCRSGAWEPVDRWSGDGGRVYCTAINALTLEVYYRYANVFGTK